MGPAEQTGGLQAMNDRHSTRFTNDEAKIYDRQIRLWGFSAQQKIMNSRTLIIGMSCINVELAKDLVLAGMNITLLDTELVKPEDHGYNFLLAMSEDPQSCAPDRATASMHGLRSMNKLVEVKVLDAPTFRNWRTDKEVLEKAVSATINCVCVAAEYLSVETLISLETLCRKSKKAFFLTFCSGKFGFCFYTLPPDEIDTQHGKLDGPDENVSLSNTLNNMSNFASFPRRAEPLFHTFALLFKYNLEQEPWDVLTDTDGEPQDVQAFSTYLKGLHAFMKEIIGKSCETMTETEIEQKFFLNELCNTIKRPLNTTASVLGGLLAQEIGRFIAGQSKIVYNALVFNVNQCKATVWRTV